MHKSLLDLKHEIMSSSNTVEDWIRLDHEVNEAIQLASEEDVQKFVASGAGEMLDMACSAIKAMHNNT